jgi:large subunit ribosomal protein L35
MRKAKKKGKLKLKSRRGARKRFKLTASGKVKRGHAFKRHILTKKAVGRKRGLRKATLVSPAETPSVRRMLLG